MNADEVDDDPTDAKVAVTNSERDSWRSIVDAQRKDIADLARQLSDATRSRDYWQTMAEATAPTDAREAADAAYWREREAGNTKSDRGGYYADGFRDGYVAALSPTAPDAGQRDTQERADWGPYALCRCTIQERNQQATLAGHYAAVHGRVFH